MLTQAKLKEVLNYDKETGIFTWRVSRGGGASSGDIAGSFDKDGYVRIQIEGKNYMAHCLAWLYVEGYFSEYDIDHKDRIKNHNWFSNLRELSRACNLRNTGNRKNNRSGIKGVSWHKSKGKWQACIVVSGKTIHIGLHDDLLEAACHRLCAEQWEEWENCDSSSPAYKYVEEYVNVKP